MNHGPIGAPAFHITVDVVILTVSDGQLKALLIKRARPPFQDSWALPGGFLQAEETLEQAASRVLHAKAGVDDVYVEQLYTFDSLDRDVRAHIPSVAYFALVPEANLRIQQSDSTEQPKLFNTNELPQLAFDHNQIAEYALNRLRSKLGYTSIVFSLLPGLFTLTQLQQTYETVLDRSLDKRNFRKKFLSLGLIEATGETIISGRQRPAQLYRFRSQQAEELARWF
jgi:8-oxo-dGTP diphosphatase